MALVERIMAHASEPENRWISVHQFFAINSEVDWGALTVAQVKAYYGMTAADIVDYDALIAQLPPANQTGNRARFINRIHAVFTLAEQGVTQYSTPAEVRVKLGI